MRTLCVLLLCVASLQAVVSPKGSPVTCGVVSATSCVASSPVSVAVGDVIMLTGFRGNVTSSGTNGPTPVITDTCSNTYSYVAAASGNTVPYLYATVVTSGGSCTLTVRRTDSEVAMQGFIAQVYSGVGAVLGGTGTGGGYGGSYPNRWCNAPAVTLASGDVAIGGFSLNGTGTPASNVYVSYPPSTLINQVQIGTTGAGNGYWLAMAQVSGEGSVTPGVGLNFGGSLNGCNRASVVLQPTAVPPPLAPAVVYWMHPPVTAGNGITVDYQPDGTYVSLTAARGVGGVAVLSGDVAAGKCIVRSERHQGLKPHAHIAVTHVPPSVRVTATAERNEVDFRVCNNSQRSIHLNPFRLNWHEANEAHTDHPAPHH